MPADLPSPSLDLGPAITEALDEIGLTLQKADQIRAFEARRKQQFPWLFR